MSVVFAAGLGQEKPIGAFALVFVASTILTITGTVFGWLSFKEKLCFCLAFAVEGGTVLLGTVVLPKDSIVDLAIPAMSLGSGSSFAKDNSCWNAVVAETLGTTISHTAYPAFAEVMMSTTIITVTDFASASTKGNIIFYRPLRGGSWLYDPTFCMSANRNANSLSNRNTNEGFRLCFC